MSDIKPIIEEPAMRELLSRTFEPPIDNLVPIESGHMARVFSFGVEDREYVLRFTKEDSGSFKKEKMIYDQFARPTIPIPPLIELGTFNELYFSISQKMPGQELSALSKDDYFQVLPSNMKTLLAIHQSDVSQFSGYSWLGEDGNGVEASWEQALKRVMNEDPDDFFGLWHTLFDSLLDRDYFELVYQKMVSLIPYCSKERYLVHRDYDYNNVLAKYGEITAVLDWGQVSYGDFVF
ncbi:MAG: aminoglycoside phosphotransferase family protein, partial [Chloroflexota bacterium]